MNVRSIARSFPPIARRDAVIAELKDKVRRAQRQRESARKTAESAQQAARQAEKRARAAESSDGSSWRYKLVEAARLRKEVEKLGVRDPFWDVNDKSSGYAFARSHGYDVPTHIAAYDDFEGIAWNDLPEAFVVKTVNGSTSHGVVPLQRRGNRVVDLLDVRQGEVEIADVVAYLNRKNAQGRCSRDVVIEELLRSPFDPGRLAPDLKLYCFYGEVGMIMIRDVGGSRFPEHYTVRFLDADGADLGEAIVGRAVDQSLPAPLHLADVVAAGERLSAAVPVPFIRVDLYERPEGVVFGEVTPAPGGKQDLRPDLDRRLGEIWEQAEARLRAEAITSKAVEVRYGEQD